MLDRPLDSPDNNFSGVELVAGEGMLCLAPHPDDEVLGCAGLLMLAQRKGLRVHTIIVTAGEQGLEPRVLHESASVTNPRLAESYVAARIMGLPVPDCWHLADRGLRHAPPLINRIIDALRTHRPRWLLLPALTEPHPDHQALALAGMAAAQQYGDVSLLFYEVGAPTQPNTIVDISAVAHLKWQALEAFASQEERHAYRQHAQAMATVRAFVSGPNVVAAEAYWQLSAQALAADEVTASLGGWPLQRSALQLAATPQQLPLVSIIIRSMNRRSLTDAIASVAAQTYPNIEIVLVNASGGPHPRPAYPAERLALRLVGQVGASDGEEGDGAGKPLSRAAAANLGLQSMQGEFGLFLDDDDLLRPVHLQKLLVPLQEQVLAAASYSGVRVEGPGGQWLRDYDIPWQRERLWGINYLPIHAVLFRSSAVRAADAQFDEQLPVMEDWDFWCHLSHHGPFLHVPGVGAVYRQGLGTSRLADAQHANYWAPWHQRILEQHARRWGPVEQSATLAWHAVALDRLEQVNDQLRLQQQAQSSQHDTQVELLRCVEMELKIAQSELQKPQTQLHEAQNELRHARAQLDQSHANQQQTVELLNSAQDELLHARAQIDQSQANEQQAVELLKNTQNRLLQARAQLDQSQANEQQTLGLLNKARSELQHFRVQLHEGQTQAQQTHAQLQESQQQLHQMRAQMLLQAEQLKTTLMHHAHDEQLLGNTQMQLQQLQRRQAQLLAEHSLAERSLQMLQQSRPVRASRALRRVLGLGK